MPKHRLYVVEVAVTTNNPEKRYRTTNYTERKVWAHSGWGAIVAAMGMTHPPGHIESINARIVPQNPCLDVQGRTACERCQIAAAQPESSLCSTCARTPAADTSNPQQAPNSGPVTLHTAERAGHPFVRQAPFSPDIPE